MPRTAIYMRVSTDTQTHDSQKADIDRWLERNPLPPGTEIEWYIDTGSGMDISRKEMDRLRRHIEAGAVDTVICQRIDRLARRVLEGLTLLSDWSDKGIRVVSVMQGLEFGSTNNKFLATMFLAVAEMEHSIRKERCLAGIAVAKAKGKYKDRGGSRPGQWAKKTPSKLIKELLEKGVNKQRIAAIAGVSRNTVVRHARHYEGRDKARNLKEQEKILKHEPKPDDASGTDAGAAQ